MALMLTPRIINAGLVVLSTAVVGLFFVVGLGVELEIVVLCLASSTLVGYLIRWLRFRKRKRLTSLDVDLFQSTPISEQDLDLIAKARASVQEESVKTGNAYRLVTYPLYALAAVVYVILINSGNISFNFLATPLFLGAIIYVPRIGHRLVLRRRESQKYALWLRRFHLARTETALRGLLSNMFHDIAQIYTLRDDTFSYSHVSGLLKVTPHFLWILPVQGFLWAILMIVQAFAYCGLHDIAAQSCAGYAARVWSNLWIQSGNLLLVGLIGVLIARRIMRRKGFSHIQSASQAESALTAMSRKVKSGMSVYSCAPENWREVIQTFLSRASAVVIDLREVSDNLVWEIYQCSECLNPSQVVIVCVESDDKRREVLSLLESDRHRTWFLQCPFVVFKKDPEKDYKTAPVFVAYLQRAILRDQIIGLSKQAH